MGFQPRFEQVELVWGNANLEADFTGSAASHGPVGPSALSKTVLDFVTGSRYDYHAGGSAGPVQL